LLYISPKTSKEKLCGIQLPAVRGRK